MSRSARPSAPRASAGRDSGVRARIGSALGGLVLTPGHLPTIYVTCIAYMANPAGPWDSETVFHSDIASGPALVLSGITALLTWLFVKVEWLRGRWYAVPALLAAAAVLRLTPLAPGL